MSGDWERYSKRNCPVCFGARNDCRRDKRTNIVRCRYRGATSPRYYYLRDDSLGFGMYQLIEDREAWSKEQRQLSEFEKEQRRLADLEIKRQREEAIPQGSASRRAAQYANSLSIEERALAESEIRFADRQIRKILDQLWLWPSHLEKLRKRFSVLGLEAKKIDELIKEADCKSVHQWQGLDIPVSDLFPGVRLGGKSLLIQGDGILIPIKNEEGLYIGLQLRLDRPTEGKKYVWLAGERKRAKRPSSKLRTGELPMALNFPSHNWNDIDTIGLAEGVGFKGYLAAHRLNIPFISASGGHFYKSPKLLRHYLDFLGCNKSTQIVLFADAGSIKNKSTLSIYKNTIALIESWGYKVKIGWWNQVEKSVGDIDEIDQDKLKEIEYLSWNEFIAKGNQEIREALNLINRIDRTATELKRIEKKLKREQQRQERSEREKILAELTPDEYSRKQYQEYRKLKDFNGKIDITVHEIRLPDLISRWNMRGILVPKSEKGTGKTYRFNELKDRALELGMKIVSFVPRRGLAREQAAKMKMNYIDQEGFFKTETYTEERKVEHRQINLLGEEEITYTIETVTRHRLVTVENAIEADTIVLCYDSIHKLRGWDFSNTLIFLDELETGIKHLTTSSTLADKRGEVMTHFEQFINEALSNGGGVVATDADASNIAVNYLHRLAPFAKITKVLNTHPTPAPWDIDLYRGRKHKKKVINEIIDAIASNQKIAIAMDSQSDARAIFAELKEKFPHLADSFKVLDSEAAETKQCKEFIQDINGQLLR
ncbi:MAG: hypothetical protein QNJ38_17560, partial [Prochloraceae cyanobacterium]|nr:hypothetical protein [Prochloraceae cyanobacterium]